MVAGATAAVVAGALTVPALVQGEQVDDDRPAVVVMTDPGSSSGKTTGDPDSVQPTTSVAAGDTAIYAYFTMSQVKESGGRRVLKRTWRLYDKDKKVYEQTPWAWLDVAGGGESIAVLERVAARRVGVTGSRGVRCGGSDWSARRVRCGGPLTAGGCWSPTMTATPTRFRLPRAAACARRPRPGPATPSSIWRAGGPVSTRWVSRIVTS
ncbi:heterocycloanthracin/sonorensin family bacteriocin [Streptosporangium roseum]|uniref:heterocycloanthracin/sonorensin family bacteriocin n=1 Tax=Streptosporangium roseum TaxID=2001 RepID=UPI003329DB18